MPAWKVLVIGVLTCACLALGLATLLVPMSHSGGQRWMWLGGLLTATACTGGLFVLFLRYASGSLDAKPSRSRN